MKRSTALAIALAALLLAGALVLVGCSNQNNTSIVDDKRELSVPGTTTICYMLEVEIENLGGEEVGEHVYCAPKAEYDANTVGDEWRDANRVIKK